MNNSDSTINFLYWLHNFKDLENTFAIVFGVTVGRHFYGKILDANSVSQSQFIMPSSIVKVIMTMEEDNKRLLLNWIEENYSCGLV